MGSLYSRSAEREIHNFRKDPIQAAKPTSLQLQEQNCRWQPVDDNKSGDEWLKPEFCCAEIPINQFCSLARI